MRLYCFPLLALLSGTALVSASKERQALRNREDSSLDRELQDGARTKIEASGEATRMKLDTGSTMVDLGTNYVRPRIVGGDPVDAGTYVSLLPVRDCFLDDAWSHFVKSFFSHFMCTSRMKCSAVAH